LRFGFGCGGGAIPAEKLEEGVLGGVEGKLDEHVGCDDDGAFVLY
jgi:hypothetical protein